MTGHCTLGSGQVDRVNMDGGEPQQHEGQPGNEPYLQKVTVVSTLLLGGVVLGGGDTKCQHTCAPTRTLSAVPLRDAGTECSRHIQAGGPVCIYVCVLFTSGSTAAVDGGSLQGGRTIAIPARRLAINAAVFCRVCRRGRVGLASTAAAVSQELFLFFFGTEAHRRCTSHSGAVQMMHWHRGSEQQRVPDPEDCARAQRVGHCTPGEFGRPLKYLIQF